MVHRLLGVEMTEYVIKEIGPHQWLVFADRKSIALCADENEAVKVMTERSARGSRSGTSSVDNWSEQNPPGVKTAGPPPLDASQDPGFTHCHLQF